MLSSYRPGHSFLHRAKVLPKFLLTALAALSVFAIDGPWPPLLFVPILLTLSLAAGIPPSMHWRAFVSLRYMLPLVLLGAWIQLGATAALLQVLRILDAYSLALLFQWTTRTNDILIQVEGMAARFQWLGVRPRRISLVCALALNGLPAIEREYQLLREARIARGASPASPRIILGLLIRSLARARVQAEALAARGWSAE